MNPAYHQLPIVGVGVVVRAQESVLLVKRAHEPRKGFWSIPGGKVKLGESVKQAAIREVFEECSIRIKIHDVIGVVDLIDKDEDGRIKYHFVVIDFLAFFDSGELKPASDALDAKWVLPHELDPLNIPDLTRKIIKKAFS